MLNCIVLGYDVHYIVKLWSVIVYVMVDVTVLSYGSCYNVKL